MICLKICMIFANFFKRLHQIFSGIQPSENRKSSLEDETLNAMNSRTKLEN